MTWSCNLISLKTRQFFTFLIFIILTLTNNALAGLVISGESQFAEVLLGSSKNITLTVNNTGTKDTSNLSLTLSQSYFSYNGGTCTTSLPKGKSCTVIIKFTPLQQGIFNAIAKITYKRVWWPTLYKTEYALNGTGIMQTTPTPDPGTGNGYQGMSLPANFSIFNSESPWNKPIVSNPEIDPNSSRMIGKLQETLGTEASLKFNYNNWTVPVHVVDARYSIKRNVYSSDPNHLLSEAIDPDNNGIAENIPMPSELWQDPSTDGHLIIVDPYQKRSWEFGVAKLRADGHWDALKADTWDLTGVGYRQAFGNRWWTNGARAAGVPMIAGLIRPEEIAAGVINHALAMSSPTNRLNSFGPNGWGRWEVCSPVASNTDGHGIGQEYIPEGARVQLNPNLDLNTLGLSAEAKIVAKALQVYGAYIVDNAPETILYMQNLGPDGGAWNTYPGLMDIQRLLVKHLRVLKCDLTILDLL